MLRVGVKLGRRRFPHHYAEPLLIAISTRSPDPSNPMEELLSFADDVRSGAITDAGFASFVYSAPLDLDRPLSAPPILANESDTPAVARRCPERHATGVRMVRYGPIPKHFSSSPAPLR